MANMTRVAKYSDIPTKVSQLENDYNFQTGTQVDSKMNTHKQSAVIDHPDGSVTLAKLASDIIGVGGKLKEEILGGKSIVYVSCDGINDISQIPIYNRNGEAISSFTYNNTPANSDGIFILQYMDIWGMDDDRSGVLIQLPGYYFDGYIEQVLIVEGRMYSRTSSWLNEFQFAIGSWKPFNLPKQATKTPTSPGTPGEMTYDTNALFFCYDLNKWGRIAFQKTW